jgi:hypothetical protein
MPALKNECHEKFCLNLAVKGLPRWKAYAEAGFSPGNKRQASKRASALLQRPDIQVRLGELDRTACDMAREVKLDRTCVLNRLEEVYQRCMDAVPVKDRHGNPTGQYRFDSKGALQALRLYGQELGMFKNVSEVWKGHLDPTEGVSRADLRKMILGLCDELGFTLVEDGNEPVH